MFTNYKNINKLINAYIIEVIFLHILLFYRNNLTSSAF